jgi:hypothetical protein
MPYVMVPVPEDQVEEVMQFMLRASARAGMEEWTAESMATLFDGIDEMGKALLSFVARSTLNEKEPTEADAAKIVQLSVRETVAVMREVNDAARESNHPNIIGRKPITEVLPNGRTQEKMVLFVEGEVTALVIEAERADLAANPPISLGE